MSGREDWYRNPEWSEAIAADFAARLRRARRKEQYIRIQASYLAQSYPAVALALLEQYFALPDKFDHAAAYATRAKAFLSLGRIPDALASYEAALDREAEFPNLKTLVYVEYPYLVGLRNISSHYGRALEVLDHRRRDLAFPADHFMWHAARAMILSAMGSPAEARGEARAAMDAAGKDNSGFRFHPELGLVSDRHAEALQRMSQFHDA